MELILGMYTTWPTLHPVTICASMTRDMILRTTNLVPLACPRTPCMFLSSMTGAPSFIVSLCGGMPDAAILFRKS